MRRSPRFVYAIVVVLLVFVFGLGLGVGQTGDLLQGRFSSHTIATLSLACTATNSASIFVDSAAAPGGNGTFASPYRSMSPLAARLIEDSTIETICITGHLHGTLFLKGVASDELTLKSYGSVATLEYASGGSDYAIYAEDPDFLTSLTVSDLNLVGVNEFNGLDEVIFEDVDVDAGSLDRGIVVEDVATLVLEDVNVSNSQEELVNIQSAGTVVLEDMRLKDGGQDGLHSAVYVYASDELLMTEVGILDALGEYAFYAREVEDITMGEVLVDSAAKDAMSFVDSDDINMDRTIITDSGGDHIQASNFLNFTMTDSYLDGSGYDALDLSTGETFSLSDSLIDNSGLNAITLENVTTAHVTENHIQQFDGRAINMNLVEDALIDSNVLQDPATQPNSYGVSLLEVTEAIVQNNFIADTERAIYLAEGGEISLWNNSLSENTRGVSTGSVTFDTVDIKNNIFYCSSANMAALLWGVSIDENYSLSSDYNLFETCQVNSHETQLSDWQNDWGYDANSIEGTAGFVSTSDLHLSATSDAMDAGTPLSGLTEDIDGDARDASTPEIGADEV